MSASSVISAMLARSPRPSAISRTAASIMACRVRALRRSSRDARGASPSGTASAVTAPPAVLPRPNIPSVLIVQTKTDSAYITGRIQVALLTTTIPSRRPGGDGAHRRSRPVNRTRHQVLGGQFVEQFRGHGRRQVAHVRDHLGRVACADHDGCDGWVAENEPDGGGADRYAVTCAHGTDALGSIQQAGGRGYTATHLRGSCTTGRPGPEDHLT